MKKIFIILLSTSATIGYSQVLIGGSGPVANTSVSLQFASANKGLVLPWASTQNTGTDGYTGMSSAEKGTLIYDLSDYRFRLNANGNWKPLSENGTGSNGKSIIPITGTTGDDVLTNRTVQDNKNELPASKVSIGTPTQTPGILVLEDNNKAMILPKVASPHLNIKNPAPGMIVYDTDNKLVALFNGTVWNFLQPAAQ